jgi:hypothetical protein
MAEMYHMDGNQFLTVILWCSTRLQRVISMAFTLFHSCNLTSSVGMSLCVGCMQAGKLSTSFHFQLMWFYFHSSDEFHHIIQLHHYVPISSIWFNFIHIVIFVHVINSIIWRFLWAIFIQCVVFISLVSFINKFVDMLQSHPSGSFSSMWQVH